MTTNQYPQETLRATWTMRMKFRTMTDTEFAEMLTSLQVPNALDMIEAARRWDYNERMIRQARNRI